MASRVGKSEGEKANRSPHETVGERFDRADFAVRASARRPDILTVPRDEETVSSDQATALAHLRSLNYSESEIAQLLRGPSQR